MPGPQAEAGTFQEASGLAERVHGLLASLAIVTASSLLSLLREPDDPETAEVLAAASLATANARAATLADRYLSLTLAVRGRPARLLGITARPELLDQPRLLQAVRTAAALEGTDPLAALDRLGRSEPLRAHQLAVTDGMTARKVRGWTRVTSSSPCVVCAGLADGSVLPPSVEIYHHPGCSCIAQPVN